jgi:hypothetical protein
MLIAVSLHGVFIHQAADLEEALIVLACLFPDLGNDLDDEALLIVGAQPQNRLFYFFEGHPIPPW